MKPAAMDLEGVLPTTPGDAVGRNAEGDWTVTVGTAWMSGVPATGRLTFVSLRSPSGVQPCLVLDVDPAGDVLTALPLPAGESALTVLNDERRRDELHRLLAAWPDEVPPGTLRVPLRLAVEQARFAPPLPSPRRVLGVAANIPTHLRADLAIDGVDDLRERATRSRARVFRKHPYTPPPLDDDTPPITTGITGAFDAMLAPSHVLLPLADEATKWAPLMLDYEVEVGAVVGRALTWEDVRDASDEELRACIVGHVLVNDSKSRNVQVVGRVRAVQDDLVPAPPYALGTDNLAQSLGPWDARSAAWWSYASSWGSFTHVGPFLVEARPDDGPRSWSVVAARSYAPPAARSRELPSGVQPDVMYLRQAAVVSEDPSAPDGFLWSLPDILRSVLGPEAALGIDRLEPGDIICLGTPGGTVITAKPQWLVELAMVLLFWRSPEDWHDDVLGRDGKLFLVEGDRLFLWAEGLGYQAVTVHQIPVDAAVEAPLSAP